MIDFIVCYQSQKPLLLNARSYVETVIDSNHVRVISNTRLSLALFCSNPFKCRQIKTITILPHIWYERGKRKIRNNIHSTKSASPSIGITPPTRSNWQRVCSEITRVSREQKMLRLRKDNMIGIETRNALKQERNRLQQPSGNKTLENASVKLDQVADEFSRNTS